MTSPERARAFEDLFEKEAHVDKWTVQRFIELLHRHGDIYVWVNNKKLHIIDGGVNLISLVEELNKEHK